MNEKSICDMLARFKVKAFAISHVLKAHNITFKRCYLQMKSIKFYDVQTDSEKELDCICSIIADHYNFQYVSKYAKRHAFNECIVVHFYF